MYFTRIGAVLVIVSIIWIVWYFRELPKNIRELKENKWEYQKYLELSVLVEFKAKTEDDVNGEDCRIEYKGNLGVIIFFSAITILAVIYMARLLFHLVLLSPVGRGMR